VTCADSWNQYFCYPETANLTLEEVDYLFYEGNVVKRSRRVAKQGWGPTEGAMTSPGVIESGIASSEKDEEDAEKRENVAHR
jgi:hypothetical protein